MQIRNLNKNQSSIPHAQRGNELSEEGDLPNNFQNVEETSISNTSNSNESGESKTIFHIMVNGIQKNEKMKISNILLLIHSVGAKNNFLNPLIIALMTYKKT